LPQALLAGGCHRCPLQISLPVITLAHHLVQAVKLALKCFLQLRLSFFDVLPKLWFEASSVVFHSIYRICQLIETIQGILAVRFHSSQIIFHVREPHQHVFHVLRHLAVAIFDEEPRLLFREQLHTQRLDAVIELLSKKLLLVGLQTKGDGDLPANRGFDLLYLSGQVVDQRIERFLDRSDLAV
jgi:hypothetical protein